MEYKAFCEMFQALGVAFDKDVSSKVLIELYYSVFKKYPDEIFKAACTKAIQTLRFFPKVAEIIEIIEGSAEDRAMLAWQSVMDAIACHGYYQSVVFEDTAIFQCIEDMGGWMHLCEQTERELGFLAKDFTRLYKIHAQGPRQDAQKLIGFFEAENGSKGFPEHVPEPVHIGRQDRLIDTEQKLEIEEKHQ